MHHRDLVLAAWREIGRQRRLAKALDNIAAAVRQSLPLAALTIVHLDRPRQALETLATTEPATADLRMRCAQAVCDRLLLSLQRHPVRRLRVGEPWPDDLRPLAVRHGSSGALIGYLRDPDNRHDGIAVLNAHAGADFGAADAALLASLLEPLAVGLANELRWREPATQRARAEADREMLLARFGRRLDGDEVVGADGCLKGVMERVNLVARSDATVLLLGETGSGKEIIARTLHERSPRSQGPFIRVNCGAIPPDLIDSELFGHERGSFTGAAGQHRGWFERADRGTLFLDEIGELPPAAQVRLLRVLQDGTLYRVGGEEPLQVDVRVVAATHRDLAAMVANGSFRQDLWYRIAVFPIAIPPLRERQSDIPALAEHFARRAAVKLGLPLQLPTAGDIELLRSYAWPGNVRELAAVIERAAILGNGKGLQLEPAFGMPTGPVTVLGPASGHSLQAPSSSDNSRFPTLDEAMAAHIRSALARTHGRIEGPSGTARLLGINPHTLRSRMRKLGVDSRPFRRLQAASG